MTPAQKIEALWNPLSCRHSGVRDRVNQFLQLLENEPVFTFDMQTLSPPSDPLLTKAPVPITSTSFKTSMIWEDLAVDVRNATIGSLGMSVETSLGKSLLGPFSCVLMRILGNLIANFSDQGQLDAEAPYYAIVECWPKAARGGLKDFNPRWESTTTIFDSEDRRPATYTQPGSITSAHKDGFGYGIRIYQVLGSKLWLVWPPTEQNISWICRNLYELNYSPEHSLDMYLRSMEGLQVYLVEEGDCFDVPPLTIHCCLSLTTSIHIGVSTWSLDGLNAAKMINKKMIGWWSEWTKLNAEAERQKSEEEEKAGQGLPNRAPQIELEISWLKVAKEIFVGWKGAMKRGGPDRLQWKKLNNPEITAWFKELDKHLGDVK